MFTRLITLTTLSILLPLFATANTSSVFSADVKADTQALEYRTSYVPDDGPAESVFAHRLHYQHAFDDTWRIRFIGAQGRRGDSSLSYSYTRFELQYQYLEHEEHGWDAAFRYELQLSDDSARPDRFRIGWTSKWDIADNWQLRTNLMLGRQFSTGAGSGVFVETRGQITRRFGEGRLGLEMFNDINQTTNFGSFDDQEHQLGPIYKFKIGSLSVNASYLFGLSDSADDDNLRFHFIHAL